MQTTVGTNYFGHWYLTHLLLDPLKAAAPSRVVFVTSASETAPPPIDWDNLTYAAPVWIGAAQKLDDRRLRTTVCLIPVRAAMFVQFSIIIKVQGAGWMQQRYSA